MAIKQVTNTNRHGNLFQIAMIALVCAAPCVPLAMDLLARPALVQSTVSVHANGELESPKVRLLRHDFGRVPAGFSGICRFDLRNDTVSAWTVQKVTASCSCTVAEMDDHIIEPGSVGTLQIKYQADVKSADDKRVVDVRFDELDAPVFRLEVSAQIREPITISPSIVELAIHAGEPIPAPSLSALLYFPSRIAVSATSTEPWLRSRIVPAPVPAISKDRSGVYQAYQIDLSLDVNANVIGNNRAVLKVSHPDHEKDVSIPVQLQVLPRVSALPDRIVVADATPGVSQRRIVRLVFASAAAREGLGELSWSHDLGEDLKVELQEQSQTVLVLHATYHPARRETRERIASGALNLTFSTDDYHLKIPFEAIISSRSFK